MKLQELVNSLSNVLATIPSESDVYIKVLGNQEIANKVTIENTKEGQIIVIK